MHIKILGIHTNHKLTNLDMQNTLKHMIPPTKTIAYECKWINNLRGWERMQRRWRTSCHRPCAQAREAGGVKTRPRSHGGGRVLAGMSGLLRRGPAWLSRCSASPCRRRGVLFGRHQKTTPCTLDRHRRTAEEAAHDVAPTRCAFRVAAVVEELTEVCSCGPFI